MLYCTELDLQGCVDHVIPNNSKLIILSPLGDFDCFLTELYKFLNNLYNTGNQFIICGHYNFDYISVQPEPGADFSINTSTIYNYHKFPNKNPEFNSITTDNIITDIRKHNSYCIRSAIKGLSDVMDQCKNRQHYI